MTVNTINKAVSNVKNEDYSNGMATETHTVERENCYVKVTRKAGSLNHPEIILFKVVPKNNLEPDYSDISDKIIDSMDIYGDVSIDFQGDTIKTVVLGV